MVDLVHKAKARLTHVAERRAELSAEDAKEDTAMVNEVLCKVVAHNLCVLNQEECELGIEAMFSKIGLEEKVAELVA